MTQFCERALISTTLISPCHWKTHAHFCLQRKNPENAFLTLLKNYHKIVQKNKLCHPKQQEISYLTIYDAIYSLLVFTEKLAFFHKQLSVFTVSFKPWTRNRASHNFFQFWNTFSLKFFLFAPRFFFFLFQID